MHKVLILKIVTIDVCLIYEVQVLGTIAINIC